MESEAIDWSNESVFVKDEIYEYLNAPKWVDFSVLSDRQFFGDNDSWFCNTECKHPKSTEDYQELNRNSKVKYLRSVTMFEFFHFRERTRRDAKVKKAAVSNSQTTLKSKSTKSFDRNSEYKIPNLSSPPFDDNQASNKMIVQSSFVIDGSQKNLSRQRQSSTFFANNLLGGKEILNQITEFYSKLKKLAKKGSNKRTSKNVSIDRQGVKGKRRKPLLQMEKVEVWSRGRTGETH